ncbi:MAG: Ig-like domain-containing protein [Synergistaceae bacterium]|nr:Ig-like domain-containing protein [Synergistaceae bacterium]
MRKFIGVLSATLFAVIICGTAAFAATEVIIIPGEVYLSNSPINSSGHGQRDLSVFISEDGVLRPATSSITWSTSSEDIVGVSPLGTLSAGNSFGNTVVTASVTEGTGTCSVNVAANVIPVTNVTLEEQHIDLRVGDTRLLVGTLTPVDATPYYRDFSWESSAPSVATVVNGLVTALNPGNATITFTELKDHGPLTAMCTVKVTRPFTGIAINTQVSTSNIEVGTVYGTIALTATPSDAFAARDAEDVTWISSNPDIAYVINGSVNYEGALVGASPGTASITAETVDGKVTPTPFTVTVNSYDINDVHVSGVSVTPASASINVHETVALTATASPNNAKNRTITWSSDNTGVATVDNSRLFPFGGVVTGAGAGKAIITATTNDGEFVASSEITVNAVGIVSVIGVSINPASASISIGETLPLTATVSPDNATNKDVSWSSSNTSVATVNASSGVVTALAAGSADITVTTADGGHTDIWNLTVTGPESAPVITIDAEPLDVSVVSGSITGELSVTASVTPAGTPLSYQWYSNNTKSNTGGTAIVGGTNSSFDIPFNLGEGEYYYYCVVSATGAASVTSKVATVTVTEPQIEPTPVITIDAGPQDASVVSGSITGNLTVTASVVPAGTLLNYQWYLNTTKSNTGGTAIVGGTSSSFSIPLDLGVGEYYYYCVVSATGAVSVASNAAAVTVTAPPAYPTPVITITAGPQDADVTEGSISGSLSVSATISPVGETLTYQWYYNTTNSTTNGQVIAGATIASFAIPVALLEGTYYYYCVVGAAGAASVTSNVATVTVTAEYVDVTGVTIEPKSATVEIGETLALDAKVTPDNATNKAVVWNSNNPAVAEVDTNGVVRAMSGGTAIITVTTAVGGITDICTITVPASTPVDPEFPSSKDEVAGATEIPAEDLEEKDGKVYLKKSVAEGIAKILLDAKEVNTYILPIFEGSVAPGGVVEVTFSIAGKDLLASYADEINLIGLLFGGGGDFFDYVNDAAEYGDGKFTLLLDGDIFEGKINPNEVYELVVFIKDGGIFDLDGEENGKVISSIFLASVKKGGGGKGGCNAGYLALAMFGIAPLVLRKKIRNS